MSILGKRISRILAVLALILAVAPLSAQSTEDRLDALEAEVAKLKAAVAAARSAESSAEIEELARRIELVAAELEKLKLGEVAIEADESVHGLGPAASKVYRKTKGVSIGGYGELVYQGFSGSRDDGTASGKSDQFDLLRGIVYVGYKWDDKWLLNTELEWEHGSTGKAGEASVEFAYIDRLIRSAINVRAGLMLVPMGLLNELHEPTVFLGVRRPGVESVLIPTTWRENGIGLFGEIGPVTYRTYIVNGLDAAGFSSGGIRGGRQKGSKAKAEDLAWVGRIDWTATPGLVAGGSLYVGDSGQGIIDPSGGALGVSTRIFELHADWKWRGLRARALWADVDLGDVAGLNRALGLDGSKSVGESMEGYYLEAGYDLFARNDGDSRLVPFTRWESYDTQKSVPAGFTRDPAREVEILTVGLEWHPIEQIVVKGDWQDVDNGAGTGVDQFNLGLGWVF
jgi:hypothetical protein